MLIKYTADIQQKKLSDKNRQVMFNIPFTWRDRTHRGTFVFPVPSLGSAAPRGGQRGAEARAT